MKQAEREQTIKRTESLLGAERARASGSMKAGFDTILVVSDLHLGPGIDALSTRWDRTENFFCDRSFGRALTWVRSQRVSGGVRRSGRRLLVLNGDIFDFIRISAVPSPGEVTDWAALLTAIGRPTTPNDLLQPGTTRSERRFGLRTDDYKSVWKLSRILAGHPGFRAALSEWLRAGETIMFVKGNHDVELTWPLVHAALRHLLGGTEQNVLFVQDYVQMENLYLEHGHQHENMTAVKGPPYLPKEPDQLNLPPGSFVNRYLINPLERAEPFIDNMKPQKEMVANFIKRRPFRALGMLWHSGRFLVRSVKSGRVWDSAMIIVYLLGLLLPLITLALVLAAWKFDAISDFFNDTLASLKIPTAAAGFFAPYIFSALREVYVFIRDKINAKRHPIGDDHYGRRLAETLPSRLELLSGCTRYLAVVGHTHRLDRQILPIAKNGQPITVVYLNTGTWTPLWPKDRPDLLGRTLHPLLLLDWDGTCFTPTQLEWSDAEGEGVECVILMH